MLYIRRGILHCHEKNLHKIQIFWCMIPLWLFSDEVHLTFEFKLLSWNQFKTFFKKLHSEEFFKFHWEVQKKYVHGKKNQLHKKLAHSIILRCFRRLHFGIWLLISFLNWFCWYLLPRNVKNVNHFCNKVCDIVWYRYHGNSIIRFLFQYEEKWVVTCYCT